MAIMPISCTVSASCPQYHMQVRMSRRDVQTLVCHCFDCSSWASRFRRDVLLTVLAPGRPSAETEGLHRSPYCRTALSSGEDAFPGPQRGLARPWHVLHDRTWYRFCRDDHVSAIWPYQASAAERQDCAICIYLVCRARLGCKTLAGNI
jgi:hypothetical protein